MYPSWGNFGGPQPPNYGGSGPRNVKQPGGGHPAPAVGFGGFEAPTSGSLFSSLQQQHLQQMQQLQMLHQKQLQSVLQHGNSANTYAGGHTGPSWHLEGSGHSDSGVGAQSYYNVKQDETPAPQVHPQPPPPPPQQQPNEPQPVPPPPEPPSLKLPENNGAPKPKEANKKQSSTTEDDKSLPLQVMSCICPVSHAQLVILSSCYME